MKLGKYMGDAYGILRPCTEIIGSVDGAYYLDSPIQKSYMTCDTRMMTEFYDPLYSSFHNGMKSVIFTDLNKYNK